MGEADAEITVGICKANTFKDKISFFCHFAVHRKLLQLLQGGDAVLGASIATDQVESWKNLTYSTSRDIYINSHRT